MIRISGPAVVAVDGAVTVSYGVDGLSESRLEYEIGGIDGASVRRTGDAALVALLIPAMLAGQDIRMDAPVSSELVFRIRSYVVPLLRMCLARTSAIAITAREDAAAAVSGAPMVVTGLSGGVDSTHAVAMYLGPNMPASLRLTHFIFHDLGSHGTSAALADGRRQNVQLLARERNRPLITVRSNLARFYAGGYQQTHTLRSVSAALAVSAGPTRFLLASTGSYRDATVKDLHDIAYVDPILLPLLRSETFECIPVGGATSRAEKTAVVSRLDIAKRHLDVCVVQHPNCSRCWKCARTLTTLELLGALPDFAAVFDLKAYAEVRDGFLAHVLVSHRDKPVLAEIRSLMRSKGYKPSLRQRLLAALAFPSYVADSTIGRSGSVYRRITGFSPRR